MKGVWWCPVEVEVQADSVQESRAVAHSKGNLQYLPLCLHHNGNQNAIDPDWRGIWKCLCSREHKSIGSLFNYSPQLPLSNAPQCKIHGAIHTNAFRRPFVASLIRWVGVYSHRTLNLSFYRIKPPDIIALLGTQLTPNQRSYLSCFHSILRRHFAFPCNVCHNWVWMSWFTWTLKWRPQRDEFHRWKTSIGIMFRLS